MLIPLFTKLFEKFSINSTRFNSPNQSVNNKVQGSKNKIITNVYNQTFNTQEIVKDEPIISKLTPRGIIEEIKTRPLLQKEIAEESYIGRQITWRVRLFNLKSYNDILNVALLPDDGNLFPDILCDVKVSDYPVLKSAHKNDVLYIEGKISSINGLSISIENAKLIFLEE